MARRIEAGPIVVGIGALLLLVSLFLDWFAPGTSAWTAFEALDLVLAGLALGALLVAAGLIAPELAALDRRRLAPLALLALVIVASQIINPPPAAGNEQIEEGGWLGLAGALLMAAGALLPSRACASRSPSRGGTRAGASRRWTPGGLPGDAPGASAPGARAARGG